MSLSWFVNGERHEPQIKPHFFSSCLSPFITLCTFILYTLCLKGNLSKALACVRDFYSIVQRILLSMNFSYMDIYFYLPEALLILHHKAGKPEVCLFCASSELSAMTHRWGRKELMIHYLSLPSASHALSISYVLQ